MFWSLDVENLELWRGVLILHLIHFVRSQSEWLFNTWKVTVHGHYHLRKLYYKSGTT